MERAAELTPNALPVYRSPEGMVEVLQPSSQSTAFERLRSGKLPKYF